MTFRLPEALSGADDEAALDLLARYYRPPAAAEGFYTGAVFDTWDSTGTRARDVDRFTADDLVAVTFLSVDVDPRAAHALLRERAAEFADLLAAVGPDRDLVEEERVLGEDWAAWRLERALRALPSTGRTTASKLLARKRPKLLPIWDKVVAKTTGTRIAQWEPLRVALRAEGGVLHRRLLCLRAAGGSSRNR